MRRTAFALYLVFVLSWFLHLPDRVPAFGVLRLDLVLVCLIAALTMVTKQQAVPPRDGRIRSLILCLVAYALLTVPFVEWPGSVLRAGLPNFIKAFVFYYFTTELIATESQLRKLLTVFVAGQSFRVLEPLYLHMTDGYWGSFSTMAGGEALDRLAGAPLDIINPNGLAFVILTVIPFFHYLGPMTKLGGVLYTSFLPLALYALILTSSRSGMLGLAVTVLLLWWKSRRKLLFGGAVIIAVLVGVQYLTENQKDRYLSIFRSDTKNAATAQGRTEGVKSDFQVALRRPFFGHGLGTSVEANAHFNTRAEISHNLYTEVAIELGFVGLAIFLVFLVIVSRTVNRTLKALRASGIRDGLILRLSLAVQVWFGMNILFSFASYGLSSYEWYLLAGLSEVLHRHTPATATVPERKRQEALAVWRPRHAPLAPVSRTGQPGLPRAGS
jgi:O-Antigen ligase